MTRLEDRPAQAQSYTLFVFVLWKYVVSFITKYKGIVGISFRSGYQHHVSFCIHKYVAGNANHRRSSMMKICSDQSSLDPNYKGVPKP
jgi:hypothetical protein